MLTAIVLVCSLSVTPDLQACTRDNAVGVLRVPEQFAVPSACLMSGGAYLAQTELGRQLAADERVKVLCLPDDRAKRPLRAG
ncbi:hypothetical protein [Oleisolibacter albus]|uniref:hypothetical protein n=1 Tax=Oleisolibacter albus TaxID=2171757 RepID=UPI000DF2D750|nr:hypothetical protein [Oleisolibacter albus]